MLLKGIVVVVIVSLCILLGQGLIYSQTPPEPPKAVLTKADLEGRLIQLKQGLEQAQANVHAYEGAIADCQYWLEELNKKSQPPAPKPQPKPEPAK